MILSSFSIGYDKDTTVAEGRFGLIKIMVFLDYKPSFCWIDKVTKIEFEKSLPYVSSFRRELA